jgi:hypothetical protein
MKRPTISEVARDAAILAGSLAIIIGLGLAWRPLAYLAAGTLLISFALLWEIDSERRKAKQDRERYR